MNREKVTAIFERIPSACFVGHTHMPGLLGDDYQFRTPAELGGKTTLNGRQAVVNIGSVGQPRDRDPRACYAVWNGSEVIWRRVAYDVESMVKAILATDGLERFNAHRLRDGR